ncbi:MAG: outer membrane protein transport protein [Proteobacteria bacterium]|nr:outer membrane protein transport protein [Pseudomonadota bacterium]
MKNPSIEVVARSGAAAGLVFVGLLLAGHARAAGFGINEISTAGLGMGNAITAVADRPSAVVFNPAGLAFQRGLGVEANLSLIIPAFGYDTHIPATGEPVRANAKNQVFAVPTLFASYRWREEVALGLGIYSPYGLGVAWNDTVAADVPWWGRNLVTKIELQSVFINPTVAVRLHERLALGAGLIVAQAKVSLARAIANSIDPADDVDVELSGDDLGFGATAGLLIAAIPQRLNLGVGYRSAVRMTFAGQGVFTKEGSSAAVPLPLRGQLIDGAVEVPMTLPHTLYFGLAVFPLPRLSLGANVDLTAWSSIKDLRINFLDHPELSSVESKRWHSTYAVRLGVQYELVQALLVRLGFIFDQTPVPAATVGPDLPDVNRFLLACGAGYTFRGVRADFAYQFMVGPGTDTAATAPIVGQHDASAHLASLSLGFNLDL